MASEEVVECVAVPGGVAAAVAVGDLLPDGVGFGAVELELRTHVVDGEFESSDLA